MHRYRSHTCGELRETHVGETARLSGWVHRVRDHGGLLFIDLRDHYGMTQCVVDPDSPAFKLAESVRAEWCIRIDGEVKKRTDETINDTIDENCDCVGEVEDAVSEAALAFGMFPNPSNGEVTLSVEGFHTRASIQLMDASGRVVWSKQNMALQGNVVIDLSSLSSGTYNVMLSDERGVSVKRLAIQH